MKNKLPFEITPQIKRYIDSLVKFSIEFPGEKYTKTFETFSRNEQISPYAIDNVSKFIKYMEEKKIVACEEVKKSIIPITYEGVQVTNLEPQEGYPEHWTARVLNANELLSLSKFTKQEKEEPEDNSGIFFDYINRTLKHGNFIYTFHENKKGKEYRLKLFKILWENKCLISKTRQESGVPQNTHQLAAKIELVLNTKTDKYNDAGQEKTKVFAINIVKALQRKGFSVSITTKGGILLTFKE